VVASVGVDFTYENDGVANDHANQCDGSKLRYEAHGRVRGQHGGHDADDAKIFSLPVDKRDAIRRDLYDLGAHAASIFPDLDGIARSLVAEPTTWGRSFGVDL
jgi:hypothetical protein